MVRNRFAGACCDGYLSQEWKELMRRPREDAKNRTPGLKRITSSIAFAVAFAMPD
jgi:hypothetical protein